MATDLLKVSANERIDLVDFDFLVDSGLQANLREPNAQFFTNPGGQRTWILDGFAMSNPAGKQLEVTKGRAILAQREGAVVYHGLLTTEGDASKILDLSLLTPSTSYGVYVRFEYVDGDNGSRTFWNPAGVGSELSQTVSTRRNANWSMRVELTNPGAEWTRIGTVDNTGGSLAITDERSFYFEGAVDSSYDSGWSSDGGGSATDRNADRAQYGVTDLQTFTEAMRQCLEDIKGRGLRRWWDRDIGGMNIGFDAAPVEDNLAVGDANFRMLNTVDPTIHWDSGDDCLFYDRASNEYHFQVGGSDSLMISSTYGWIHNRLDIEDSNFFLYFDGVDPYLNFDTDDYIQYDRSTNEYHVRVGSADSMVVDGSSVWVRDRLEVEDSNFYLYFDGTDPFLYFDTNDGIYYDRSANEYHVQVAGTDSMVVDGSSVWVRDRLEVEDSNFYLYFDGTDPFLYFDTNDFSVYDRSSDSFSMYIGGSKVFSVYASSIALGTGYPTIQNSGPGVGSLVFDSLDYLYFTSNQFQFRLGNTERLRISTSGVAVAAGLYVGSASGTPTDNDIYADGDITAVGSFKLGSSEQISYTGSSAIHLYVASAEKARVNDGHVNALGFYAGDYTTNPGAGNVKASTNVEAVNGSVKAATYVEGGYGFFNSLSVQTPSTASQLTHRHAQNAVIARGFIDPSTSSILGDHFNISSVTGNYGGTTGVTRVVFDVAIDANCAILVNPTVPIGGGASITTIRSARVVKVSTTTVDVYLSSITSGSSTIVGHNNQFSIVVVGRPSGTP